MERVKGKPSGTCPVSYPFPFLFVSFVSFVSFVLNRCEEV
jgi:hypothetical protein